MRPMRFLMRLLLLVAVMWLIPSARAEAEGGLSGTLLYRRLTEGTWQIWRTDLVTGTHTQVTFSPGDKRFPGWTPEGRIVYHTSNLECYLIVDAAQPHQPVLRALWPIKDVSWSPERTRMAFTRLEHGLVTHTTVWVADSSGTPRRLLIDAPGINASPSWSPDGSRLAYMGGLGYGADELYLVNPDGTERQPLTSNRARDSLPAWSRDGKRIVFNSDVTDDHEIWLMQIDGSGLQQLTQTPGLDTRPVWSPDGAKIAFTTNRSGVLEIWVMSADGTHQQRLVHAEGGVCDPAWR